jgi:hypothetical protein
LFYFLCSFLPLFPHYIFFLSSIFFLYSHILLFLYLTFFLLSTFSVFLFQLVWNEENMTRSKFLIDPGWDTIRWSTTISGMSFEITTFSYTSILIPELVCETQRF